jgi:hypothetical protein
MKTKYWVVITLMIAIATPAVAQITGAGGTGSLGGTSTNGIGGSIGAPAGALNSGPTGVAPNTTGNTLNPGQSSFPTQQQQQTTTIPTYVTPSSNLSTTPGMTPTTHP